MQIPIKEQELTATINKICSNRKYIKRPLKLDKTNLPGEKKNSRDLPSNNIQSAVPYSRDAKENYHQPSDSPYTGEEECPSYADNGMISVPKAVYLSTNLNF